MQIVNATYDIFLSLTIDHLLKVLHSMKYRINLVNLPKKSQIIKLGLIKGLNHKQEIAEILILKYKIKNKVGANLNDVRLDIAKSISKNTSLEYKDIIKTKSKIKKLINSPFKDMYKHMYELEIKKKYKSRTIAIKIDQKYIDCIEWIRKYQLNNEIPIKDISTIGSTVSLTFFVGFAYYEKEILDELYNQCKDIWFYNTSIEKGIIYMPRFNRVKFIFQEYSLYKKSVLSEFSSEINNITKNLKKTNR